MTSGHAGGEAEDGRDVAGIVRLLLDQTPAVVQEAVNKIEKEFPQYQRIVAPEHAGFLARTVERSITGFIDLRYQRGSTWPEIREFFCNVGRVEAQEGISEETSQAAFRIGAAIAIQRLTVAAERHPDVDANAIAGAAAAVLDYLNKTAQAVAQGHHSSKAVATSNQRAARARLVGALVDPDASIGLIQEYADECRWPLPEQVAALALRAPSGRRWPALALPPDVLLGLHLDHPCVIVPDPEGPGRLKTLENGLKRWRGALGPAVTIEHTAKSLTYARQALSVMGTGMFPARKLIHVSEHLPLLIMAEDPFLTDQLIQRRLRPLLRDFQDIRVRRLAETFLLALKYGFVATEIASELDVHPQTVRYRIRQLEGMFMDSDITDPEIRLEYHMALHALLAKSPNDV